LTKAEKTYLLILADELKKTIVTGILGFVSQGNNMLELCTIRAEVVNSVLCYKLKINTNLQL